MGIYVVDVEAAEWANGEVYGPLGAALDGELARRGLGTFTPAAAAPEPAPDTGGGRGAGPHARAAPGPGGLLGRFGRRNRPGRPAGPEGLPDRFEEKVNRPYDGLEALCRAQPAAWRCEEALLDWDVLVPVDFHGVIELPVSAELGGDGARVRSAHRTAEAGRRLAAVLGLPDSVPRDGGNLALTGCFHDLDGERAAAAHGAGPWLDDLDAAYFTALYLGAAEHALRRGRAIAYC
ncbi:hypothetical protein HYE82_20385 [Streptomyces sp. BR123]|uniref:hypothetical protein n=1 Tax=Streptomyces sp. BR123 TaxID=2749828 RepID=UPI0015C45B1B|nr:hypothetical protein [Streptomyces sp. BR123]NXY96699.1 hypothetical protein [Streptomyces sp. BR123]